MAGRVECVAGVERTRVESEWVVAVGGGSRLAGWLERVKEAGQVWSVSLAQDSGKSGKARLGKGA